MPHLTRRSLLLSAVALGMRVSAGERVQTADEAAAGVIPANGIYPPGDVRRYGATLDGVTDDGDALARWARVGGRLSFPVASTAMITTAIALRSGTMIEAASGATILCIATDISFFEARRESRIHISGLHFQQAKAGTAAYVGAVVLQDCTDCLIENCEFEGMQWAGVQLENSSRCTVRNNYFHDWRGTVPDAADVCVYKASDGNVVDGNRMYGGGAHGILCQDPYSGLVPKGNVFANNHIGQHTAYGITVYCPGPSGSGDSYNRIIGNQIESIQGSYVGRRSSGAGIYVVGFWAGATQVTGNRIANCCVQTRERSLAPAGIGINGIASDVTRPVLKDNVITSMIQGDGILVVSSPGGCDISGGSIELPHENDGNGPGGASLCGCGVRVENSSRVAVRSVQVTVNGAGSALFCYANGVAISDIAIEGASFTSNGAAAALRTESGGPGKIHNFMVGTAQIRAASATAPAVQMANVEDATLSDVVASAVFEPALYIANCSKLRISGGVYASAGSIVIRTAGNCSGSSIDRTVNWGAVARKIENRAVALSIEWTGEAPPTAGVWAIGDRVRRNGRNGPVKREPKAWRCVQAGSPGTWVAEDNG